MLIAGEPNIQDVIAFPKLRNAKMPLGDAPSWVTQEQLDVLGIELTSEVQAKVEKEKTEELEE